MGRRAAPQPLRLSDPTTATTLTSSSLLQLRNAHAPQQQPQHSASSNLSPNNAQSQTATSPDAHSVTATAASSNNSTTTSPIGHQQHYGASPRSSPRVSPFTSRFSTRRPQTSRTASDDDRLRLKTDDYTPALPAPDGSYRSISSTVAPPPPRSATIPTPSRSPAPSTSPAPTPEPPGATASANNRSHQNNKSMGSEGGARLKKTPNEHSKKFSRGNFFHFAKSSKASNTLPVSSSGNSNSNNSGIINNNTYHNNGSNSNSNTLAGGESRHRTASRGKDGSEATSQIGTSTQSDYSVQPVPSYPSTSEASLASSPDSEPASAPNSARKNKPKPFGRLGRSKSIREKDPNGQQATAPPIPSNLNPNSAIQGNGASNGPRTAPPSGTDRAFRDMMNSAGRNRSEDRAPSRDATSDQPPVRDPPREREHRGPPPVAMRENGGGSNFFSGLRSSSTKAADMISKSLFGKSHSRNGPAQPAEPVVDDEHYEIKVLNLPLVEQTRKTRISKRLETSRDKTEFWMPAFAWRAIDYLNYKGCEVEGLYRVPGSGPQIKRWQRKFDEEYDVNLFEVDDLYDINIVGSMLKAWLRELPDELFPKAAQDRISRACAGSETVPQLLIDELSALSPFNYYLLFAITCHLSLLLAHSDKNKMDFRNLCICFQPCMKIDAFCFKFLVCDWRECWKGCANETKYIEEEYRLFDQPPPKGLSEPERGNDTVDDDSEEAQQPQQQQQQQSVEKAHDLAISKSTSSNSRSAAGIQPDTDDDEFHESRERQDDLRDRNLSLSESSSKQSYTSAMADAPGRVGGAPTKKKPLPLKMSVNSIDSTDSSLSTNMSRVSEDGDTVRGTTRDLRPLSPIKPLSPIGF